MPDSPQQSQPQEPSPEELANRANLQNARQEERAAGRQTFKDTFDEARAGRGGRELSPQQRAAQEERDSRTRDDLNKLGIRPGGGALSRVKSLPKESLKTAEQQQAYMRLRAEELRQRVRAHAQSSRAKALTARAVQVTGIIKQSNFFYGLAFGCALLGDILDFLTFSLPLFDFILGLLLLTLVYPYISNPTVRLTTYFMSLFDFVPLVGFLPFWTLATIYAWHKWRKEAAAERAREAEAMQPKAIEAEPAYG